MSTPSAEQLWDEMVYLAYHLHWSLESILDLDHGARRGIIARVRALESR